MGIYWGGSNLDECVCLICADATRGLSIFSTPIGGMTDLQCGKNNDFSMHSVYDRTWIGIQSVCSKASLGINIWNVKLVGEVRGFDQHGPTDSESASK